MARDLEALYREYNKLYFGGQLPTIPVRWGQTYTKGHAAEFVTHTDDTLSILIIPELKKFGRYSHLTLLHEMIHVKLRDKKGDIHGPMFQREMKRLARIGAFQDLW